MNLMAAVHAKENKLQTRSIELLMEAPTSASGFGNI